MAELLSLGIECMKPMVRSDPKYSISILDNGTDDIETGTGGVVGIGEISSKFTILPIKFIEATIRSNPEIARTILEQTSNSAAAQRSCIIF